jgi:hypothetical protein
VISIVKCIYSFLFDHFLEARAEMRAIVWGNWRQEKILLIFPDLKFLAYPSKIMTFIGILKYILLIIFGQNVWFLVIVEMWLAWAGLKTTMHSI